MDIKAEANRIAKLVEAANELDALGHTAEAEKLTVIAAKEKEDLDIKAEEAGEGPSSFEKKLTTLCTKVCSLVDNPSRFQKKLNEVCEAKNCKVDARKLRNTLEDLADLLQPFKA